MRLVSLVALPESSEGVAALVHVLLCKSRDKDVVVVARALELLVQMPAASLLSTCSLPHWLAFFRACVTHCSTGTAPVSFLQAFTRLSAQLLSCDTSGGVTVPGSGAQSLVGAFPGLRHPLCFLAMVAGPEDEGTGLQRAAFRLGVAAPGVDAD
ncbi:MAG: hypothetical protein WDW36_009008 [Sanguina aurantia]